MQVFFIVWFFTVIFTWSGWSEWSISILLHILIFAILSSPFGLGFAALKAVDLVVIHLRCNPLVCAGSHLPARVLLVAPGDMALHSLTTLGLPNIVETQSSAPLNNCPSQKLLSTQNVIQDCKYWISFSESKFHIRFSVT